MACSNIKILPEDCLSTILSLTTPQDACRMLLVSLAVRPAAESDTVWDRFLPCDCWDIVARSDTPLRFSSKKELFFILSDSILIDGGSKAFALEKSSGLKSFILSARELSILYSNEQNSWSWKSITNSRFAEVAELKTSGRLEIQGTIRTRILSPHTTYKAYLQIKISDRAFGLDSIPCETSIMAGDRVLDTNTTYLREPDSKKQQLENLLYWNRIQMLKGRVNEGDEKLPSKRKDGWLEIELGEFFTSESDEVVTMRLMEIKGHQLKGGLIIQGIEVRPKY
ncbi:unnamed protein product [Fraxinus pennsylvanica]|uniref:F-box domain-containing protein n=1 Tax=Fraxinus pennsylvanica TaxID=56036 RepID=A0AAD1ZKL9_9LAMI|nr:unnamed protein product [Fraxinus pennsylvanica]